MKEYSRPTLEIAELSDGDIITTSIELPEIPIGRSADSLFMW